MGKWSQLGLAISQRVHHAPVKTVRATNKPRRKKTPPSPTLFEMCGRDRDPLDDPLDDLYR
jgi:hypothetical protein